VRKALEGATLACFFFMMYQTTRAASIPRPARPPTTPPAIAPALEPPPPPLELELEGLVVGGSDPVPVLVLESVDGRVTTEGFMAVLSGPSPAALAASGSHSLACVTSRYAQCGTPVPPGMYTPRILCDINGVAVLAPESPTLSVFSLTSGARHKQRVHDGVTLTGERGAFWRCDVVGVVERTQSVRS